MAFPSSLSWRNSYFWMVSIWSSSFLDFCLIGIFPSFFFFCCFGVFPYSHPQRRAAWFSGESWRAADGHRWFGRSQVGGNQGAGAEHESLAGDGERWGEMGRDGERWGEMGRDGEIWMGNWDMFWWYIYFFDGWNLSTTRSYGFVPSNGELTATDMASLNREQTHMAPVPILDLYLYQPPEAATKATKRGNSFNDGAGFLSFCFNSVRFCNGIFWSHECWLLQLFRVGSRSYGFSVTRSLGGGIFGWGSRPGRRWTCDSMRNQADWSIWNRFWRTDGTWYGLGLSDPEPY